MNSIPRLFFAIFLGATLAVAATVLFDPISSSKAFRVAFPPDLWAITEYSKLQLSDLGARAMAGALAAAVIATRIPRGSALLILFALTNPFLIFAFLNGAEWTLFFSAAFIVWAAIVTLVAKRDGHATIGLGVAIAAAALLHNGIIAIYPIVLFLGPLLSPWGFGLRRLAGFTVAIWAPFAMTSLSLAYLFWLLETSNPAPEAMVSVWQSAITPDSLMILAGAGLLALAARRPSFVAFATASVGAAALLVSAKLI